jgi:dephospho-CoA kinase
MNANRVTNYIGVTGLPGSGKGEFISILRELLTQNGIGLRYYSLSDELRDEARRRSMPVERPVLRAMANELRLKFGAGVLSSMLCKKISQELEQHSATEPTVLIIDAIRTPDEVLTLRQELGSTFMLVAVEAPIEVLIDRVSGRARFDERTEVVTRKDVARKMILGEAGHDEPTHGHNIAACIAMADHRLDNSHSLDSLSQQVNKFVEVNLFPES